MKWDTIVRLFLYLDFVSELRKLSALVQNCADNLHLAD